MHCRFGSFVIVLLLLVIFCCYCHCELISFADNRTILYVEENSFIKQMIKKNWKSQITQSWISYLFGTNVFLFCFVRGIEKEKNFQFLFETHYINLDSVSHFVIIAKSTRFLPVLYVRFSFLFFHFFLFPLVLLSRYTIRRHYNVS